MAAPLGSFDDYTGGNTLGIVKYDTGVAAIDMDDALVEINRKRSFIMGMLPAKDTPSVAHTWKKYDVGSIDETIAFPDGADYTYSDQDVTTEAQNVARLTRVTMEVSGTALNDKYYTAFRNPKDFEQRVKTERLARVNNWCLYNSRLVNSGETVPRRTRGLRESIARAGNITAVGGALTDTLLKQTAMQGVWADGHDGPFTIITSSTQKAVIDGFAYGNTPWIEAQKSLRVSNVTGIETPYGTAEIKMERPEFLTKAVDDTALIPVAIAAGDAATYTGQSWLMVLCLGESEMPYWEVGWFRRPWQEEPPRDGDRWRAVLSSQFMLIDYDGTAGYILATLT